MSITVYPYKLTQRELEARLEPGLTVLPGQLLRFEGAKPIYGQVKEVSALPAAAPGMPEGYGVRIELLYGNPTLAPQHVVLLTAFQMVREIERLLGPLEMPLRLRSNCIGDFPDLGPLTLIEGDDFVLKYEALLLFIEAIQPYRRMLIIDPLGIFAEEDGFAYLKAGRDVQMSLQEVGSKRFLTAFGELFSPDLRESALRTVADYLPAKPGFIGFGQLLDLESAANIPLRNLILQNFQTLDENQIFANDPERAFNLNGAAAHAAITVVDLSGVSEPWKTLFYEELCRIALGNADNPVMPILLYPENYLPDLPVWVQRADEGEMNLLMLASPYVSEAVREKANNRVWVESQSQVELRGSLTLDLPVSFPLSGESAPELMPAERPVSIRKESFIFETSSTLHKLPTRNEAQDVEDMISPDWPSFAPGEVPHLPDEPVDDIDDEDFSPEMAVFFEQAEAEGADEPQAAEVPVIDLASPPPEPTLSFLTAEQLSELLASEDLAHQDGEAPIEDWDEVVQSPDDREESEPVNPNREENRWQESAPPMEWPQPEPAISATQASNAPPTVLSIQQEMPANPPPFPAPEEYERDEFDFDINLDQHPEQIREWQGESQPASGAENVPDAISRSLSEFEETDAYGIQNVAQTAVTVPSPQSVGPMPPELVPLMQGGHGQAWAAPGGEDAEMQEALDLIFPQQYLKTGDEPGVAEQNVGRTPEPEKVPIVPKPSEPSGANRDGFKVGEHVRHPSYGVGVIQKIIPMDETVILNITFESVGKRLLDPSLCDLSREMMN